MGCRCPLCNMSSMAIMTDLCCESNVTQSKPSPPARSTGWQERDAYGIPDADEPDCSASSTHEPAYLLVAHPRPEILGMIYCAVERYLRTRRGWRRRYSKDGKTESWLGTEPWDLLLGGNKAKRVPFNRLGDHRVATPGRQAAVNYSRGFETLDSKYCLVQTLSSYCEQS
eukprot:SAG31_NODE_4063_length_3625_cov_1.344016_2_plen_170_part_00